MSTRVPKSFASVLLGGVSLVLLAACATKYPEMSEVAPTFEKRPFYLIGPGDSIQVFVWRNPELSSGATVRPDGFITTPLIEDIPASDRTPTQLAREMEEKLSKYIKNPVVTVMMAGGLGPFDQRVRVIGEVGNTGGGGVGGGFGGFPQPKAIAYTERMTLLDVMIEVGGLNVFADGNRASIVRIVDGEYRQYGVRLEDLVRRGDFTANRYMLPGDILMVPEAFF